MGDEEQIDVWRRITVVSGPGYGQVYWEKTLPSGDIVRTYDDPTSEQEGKDAKGKTTG